MHLMYLQAVEELKKKIGDLWNIFRRDLHLLNILEAILAEELWKFLSMEDFWYNFTIKSF